MAVTRDGILKAWESAEELRKYLETPEGKAAMEEAVTKACENMEKLEKDKDEACAQGNHHYLVGDGFGGGYIYFRCTHCKASVRREDRPFNI